MAPPTIRAVRPDHDDAITAVVGTVLVLAITVAGIAMALFLGVPTVEQLQESSAAKNAVGQFNAVDGALRSLTLVQASRVTGLSPLQGTIGLGPGSHWLITAERGCGLAVSGWEVQPTSTLSVSGANCLLAASPCAGATTNCLEILDTSGTSVLQSYNGATAVLTAGQPDAATYNVTLYGPTPSTRSVAVILPSDRLTWQRGNSQAIYEAGAVFANERGALYLASGPRVDEGADTFLLSFPRLEAMDAGTLGGDGEHALYTRLEQRNLLVDAMQADSVQIAIHGDWSEAWCNAFLTRNTLATPAGTYTEVAGQGCSDDTPTDGVRAISYALPAASTFTLTQSVYAAELQV